MTMKPSDDSTYIRRQRNQAWVARDMLAVCLQECVDRLEDGHPPKGGRTERLIKRAKKLLTTLSKETI
jgi:hypothetical protein